MFSTVLLYDRNQSVCLVDGSYGHIVGAYLVQTTQLSSLFWWEADQGHMMVEQCTIGVACTVRQGLLVFIHTLVHSAMVILVISHEVSIVLPGPGGRAAGPGWDHNYSGSSGHIAHSTRHIVVMCALQRMHILCPLHKCMALHPISVCEVGAVFWWELWASRHTQVIGCTSLLGIKASSSDARVE